MEIKYVLCKIVFLRSVRRLLVAACVVPISPIFVTLLKEAPGSSEALVLTRATRRNNPEDTIHYKKCKKGEYIVFQCKAYVRGSHQTTEILGAQLERLLYRDAVDLPQPFTRCGAR
jgi:hypothetical protein